MERAVFAVRIADLHLYFLIVRHQTDRFDAQAHILGFLLFEVLVVDDVHARSEYLRRAALALEQYAAIQYGRALFVSEETADAVFVQVTEQSSNRIGGDAVLAEVLFTHNFDVIGNALLLQQRFDGYVFIGFFLCGHLLELEHLILASNDYRGLETYIAHVTHKGQLQVIIVTEPHLYCITALYGDFRSTVPLDFFRQRQTAFVR